MAVVWVLLLMLSVALFERETILTRWQVMYLSGSGPRWIVVPGIQGRWEWLRPALDELKRHVERSAIPCAGTSVRSGGRTRRLDSTTTCVSWTRSSTVAPDPSGRVRRVCTGIHRAPLCGHETRPRFASDPRVVAVPAVEPNARQSRYIARPWISTPAFSARRPGASGPRSMPRTTCLRAQHSAPSRVPRVLARQPFRR